MGRGYEAEREPQQAHWSPNPWPELLPLPGPMRLASVSICQAVGGRDHIKCVLIQDMWHPSPPVDKHLLGLFLGPRGKGVSLFLSSS